VVQLGFLGENTSPGQLIIIDVETDHIRFRQRRNVARWSADSASDILKIITTIITWSNNKYLLMGIAMGEAMEM